jgi:hypothetical protein
MSKATVIDAILYTTCRPILQVTMRIVTLSNTCEGSTVATACDLSMIVLFHAGCNWDAVTG